MVTLQMVASLDGFIARKDNSVSWLDGYEDVYDGGVSEESGAEIVKTIDCYVLGSRTYEHALELGWPYGDTPAVVLTSRDLPSTRKSVEFYSGDLNKLVDCDPGGSLPKHLARGRGYAVCESFLQVDLVDAIRLTIAPILLGDGLRLFSGSTTERRWKLEESVAYKNGFVALSYKRALSKVSDSGR
jgi:dihydrofolate reductase